MKNNYKIFCIIPAYNEQAYIKQVIREVRPEVDRIIVVDDGSADQTGQLAESENVIVLKHIINRGQGAALKTGTLYALTNGADVIIHYDADCQFNATDIKSVIWPIINSRVDIVFGSRYLTVNKSIPIFKKFIILPLAKFVNKIFLHVNLTDPQSGFRAMSKFAAYKIDWQQDRMAHCSEILARAMEKKLKFKEVPISITYHNFGQKLMNGYKILKDLFIGMLID